MSTLTAVVILLAAVSVLNLLLLVATARRLRSLADQVEAGLPGQPGRIGSGGPAPGKRPDGFSVTGLDGQRVDPGEVRLVGFLSEGCRKCHERLPFFLAAARAVPGDRRQVLAVVVGGSESTGPEVAGDGDLVALGAVAQVVREPRNGPVSTAFGITGFPSFCTLAADGTVLASGDAALVG